MGTAADLKASAHAAIDARREQIEAIGDQIMAHPELGFKEFDTARLVAQTMAECGLPHQTGLAITGVKGVLECASPGPAVALLGELDSLLVADHPMADPDTGAAHACGHNAQIAGLMGAMMGLVDCGGARELSGRLVFLAVPAEEYVEVAYRQELVKSGRLGFLGGKPELVRLGHFSDVDMAAMIHTHSEPGLGTAALSESSNGCVVKLVRYEGLAAHAGGAPDKGINALNAAHVALAAIHAQRETFRDSDTIRVHPIITRGGDLVNVVPADVRIETYVRGKSNQAILDAAEKVDRALRAGAMALGAKVEIKTLPGYMPLRNNPDLGAIYKENARAMYGEAQPSEAGHRTGSTDMGDISHIMPALHPYMGGVTGTGHSAAWTIEDKETAYLGPAKMLASMAIDLLSDGAARARSVLKNSTPEMTVEEYLAFQNDVFRTEVYDGAQQVGT